MPQSCRVRCRLHMLRLRVHVSRSLLIDLGAADGTAHTCHCAGLRVGHTNTTTTICLTAVQV